MSDSFEQTYYKIVGFSRGEQAYEPFTSEGDNVTQIARSFYVLTCKAIKGEIPCSNLHRQQWEGLEYLRENLPLAMVSTSKYIRLLAKLIGENEEEDGT